MGVVAILVMRPRCREQTIVRPPHRILTQFLALIGESVAESIETLAEDAPSDHSFHCMTDNIDSK